MRKFTCLATLLLAACAPAAAPVQPVAPQPAPELRSAGAEIKSWGLTLRQWSLDETGRVEHVSGGRVGVNPADLMLEVRRFELPAAERIALLKAVEGVQRVLATPEHCDLMMTDGPYGSFRWSFGAKEEVLPFSGNCVKGRDHELAEAIFAADGIVDDAAKAVAVTEKRPYRGD
jgi:hypothetical protein